MAVAAGKYLTRTGADKSLGEDKRLLELRERNIYL